MYMARDAVIQYFAEKADSYDDVETQAYWNLSDDLLWDLLAAEVLPSDDRQFALLDAGGGTGRWMLKTLEAFDGVEATVFDISDAMLQEARSKADSQGFRDRTTIVQGDLHDVDDSLEETFDVIYCFHNVLGFVEQPDVVVENLVSLLAPGGKLACVVPNVHHGVYFNQKLGRLDVAESICHDHRGTFTEEMPEMHFFDPLGLEERCREAGLQDVTVYGFPVTIYPGYEETQLSGNTRSIAELLSDEESRERVFEMERELSAQPHLNARGNNLLAVGTKD